MSKAAANMGSKLLAQELKHEGIMVQVLHPPFQQGGHGGEDAQDLEIEGAVDPAVGAKRVLHEIGLDMTPEYNGLFINCEDGLQIRGNRSSWAASSFLFNRFSTASIALRGA